MNPEQQELIEIVERMLTAIHTGDTVTYSALCLPDLSCYETDVCAFRIDTLPFHLDLISGSQENRAYATFTRFDMLTPRVQIFADSAIVTYTRLMTFAAESPFRFTAFNETRVFVRVDDSWKMAHFHRSHAN